jgi:hypothetical protein
MSKEKLADRCMFVFNGVMLLFVIGVCAYGAYIMHGLEAAGK